MKVLPSLTVRTAEKLYINIHLIISSLTTQYNDADFTNIIYQFSFSAKRSQRTDQTDFVVLLAN